jgi:hypothetical protein
MFLLSSASIAAGAWLQSTTFAFAASENASFDHVIFSLIRTVLPFEHERFPHISAKEIQDRLLSLFDLRSSAYFQASLDSFNHIDRFSNAPTPLRLLELEMDRFANPSALQEADESAYAASKLPSHDLFTQMSSTQRITYLRLWCSSAFNVRRRFYTSMRTLIFATFYSLEDTWPEIGYAGPLLRPGKDEHARQM